MSRLIESIKLLDGKFYNLPFHEKRMAHTLSELFGMSEPVRLEEYLNEGEFPPKGLFKCRLVYDNIYREKTFSRYDPRIIKTVKVVREDGIQYPFKFEDRAVLDRLFGMRGNCDDVMIIRKGQVTDCSYSNIVFRRGSEWVTPASPLLEGTMRAKLIGQNKIQAREILEEDIRSFDSFKIINAMLEFDSPEIEVSRIVF